MSQKPLQPLSYTETRQVEMSDTFHGVTVPNIYGWLEEDTHETRAWVKEKTQIALDEIESSPHLPRLLARMSELTHIERLCAPMTAGGRYFFLDKSAHQNHRVLSVAPSLDGAKSTLLDPNAVPELERAEIIGVVPDPSGMHVAILLSPQNNDLAGLRIIDVPSASLLKDETPAGFRPCVTRRTVHWAQPLVWNREGSGFWYTRCENEVLAGQKITKIRVFYHRPRSAFQNDVLVFGSELADSDVPLRIDITADGALLVITVRCISRGGLGQTEVYIGPAAGTPSPFRKLSVPPEWSCVAKAYNSLYILAQGGNRPGTIYAINRELLNAAPPPPEDWHVVASGRGVPVNNFWLVDDCLVTLESRIGYDSLVVTATKSRSPVVLKTRQPCTILQVEHCQNTGLYVFATSVFVPWSLYRFDAREQTLSLIKEVAAPGVKPDDYTIAIRWCQGFDGVKVPIRLYHKRGFKCDGTHPALVQVYGGNGETVPLGFLPFQIPPIEQGMVYAIPGVRGGGELGPGWHAAATRTNKPTTHRDLIGACEWLVENGYTSHARICITGHSSGGTTVLAAMNQRPELFGAVLARSCITDALRFMRLPIGDFVKPDIGDPDVPEDFKCLHSWSPLHNVLGHRHYPPTLQTAPMNEVRVKGHDNYKMAARLQAADPSGAPRHHLLLAYDFRAHGGVVVADQQAKEWSLLLSWIFQQIVR